MWQGVVCAHMPYFCRPGHIKNGIHLFNMFVIELVHRCLDNGEPIVHTTVYILHKHTCTHTHTHLVQCSGTHGVHKCDGSTVNHYSMVRKRFWFGILNIISHTVCCVATRSPQTKTLLISFVNILQSKRDGSRTSDAL